MQSGSTVSRAPSAPQQDQDPHVERDDDGVTVRLAVGALGADVLLTLIRALAGQRSLRLFKIAQDREGFLVRFVYAPPAADEADTPI